jgi:hypothetical protein
MEAICPAKGRFALEVNSTKTQKASVIDTAPKASQKAVSFDHKYVPLY